MLIDYTYFFGDLSIGQLSELPVKDKLNWYINQYEPKYLAGVLGYATYKQLKADLLLPSIPQRWIDLLFGVEYVKDGRAKKWDGLIRLPSEDPSIVPGGTKIDIVVGRGRDIYDPVASTPGVDVLTTIIPPGVVAANLFWFFQRGYGFLRDDEYSTTGNVLTLLDGSAFSLGNTYSYFANTVLVQDTGELFFKSSPIANYVYYWYQRSQVTNTAGTGESKTDTQNARAVSPKYKMAKAWNEMKDINIAMYDFMLTNQTVYTEWYDWAIHDDSNVPFLKPINVFNI